MPSHHAKLQIWNADDRSVRFVELGSKPLSVCLSNDGDYLWVATAYRRVLVWNLATDQEVASLDGDSPLIIDALTPSGLSAIAHEDANTGRIIVLHLSGLPPKS